MKKDNFLRSNWLLILCGLVIGAAAVVLGYHGNPGNMGFCVACFLRDIAGSLRLQTTGPQYFRPEIVGIVVGACIMAFAGKEFKAKGGSSPVTRFFLGVFVAIGALVFLGCPLRMIIRIGSGDLNAVIGLVGFIVGILVGVVFLKKGFSLKRAYKQSVTEGLAFPAAFLVLFILSVATGLFSQSESGPGSMAAAIPLALVVGLIVGALAQRSRLCMAGGIRDAVMFKSFGLIAAFGAILVAVLAGNLLLGNGLHFSFDNQPIAHKDFLWNFLSMLLVGWGCILLGGCPLRQLVLAGEGNGDSAITVIGMLAGAALSHGFNLASSVKGPTHYGKIAVIAGLVVVAFVSFTNRKGD
ncbi:MAG: YedE-related selenium metabolism membrane protein [Oscillospiraceae bacterium]|jgi:YedE family putative selenium metabolism protein|nr:YedE-related selenium metabolism membrane protein [Oscillospiraceae bacterium]